jgi:uncharacterized repeat protein (TIGR03803 family)
MNTPVLMRRFLRLAIATATVIIATTTAVSAQQAAIYEIVSSFDVAEGRPNGVIQARDGRFYGTTAGGPVGSNPPPPVPIGTVFAMDAAGTRTTLHTFYFTRLPNSSDPIVGTDGTPMSNLFEGADGNFYGTTYTFTDGSIPPGQIFRISPAGDFTRLSGARELRAGVIEARDGRLYGNIGGSGDLTDRLYGNVFRVETNGTLTILHRFDGTESVFPVEELLEIDNSSLYGVTVGGNVFPPGSGMLQSVPATIFRVEPATGAFSIRYTFTDGSRPGGRLIQGSDGLIYGTTVNGGDFRLGTIFSLDRAGTLTTLHHFAGDDGANPNAGVIQGTDGRLYGTTTNGGAFGQGTVFVINITGGLTTLHDFTLADGANPRSELIQASDGAFYGAAPNGGPNDRGVVFRVRLETSPPPTGEFFEIVSRNSGKCLDVFGASTDAGAQAIQWICHGGANQQWRLEPAGGGAVRIIARHSGQALDVFGALLDDVTPIIQWPVHGGDNQAWTLEPAGDGYVRLVVRHSGKAMDVEFASTGDGARVIQYTPHSGANQQWLLRQVMPIAADDTP